MISKTFYPQTNKQTSQISKKQDRRYSDPKARNVWLKDNRSKKIYRNIKIHQNICQNIRQNIRQKLHQIA